MAPSGVYVFGSVIQRNHVGQRSGGSLLLLSEDWVTVPRRSNSQAKPPGPGGGTSTVTGHTRPTLQHSSPDDKDITTIHTHLLLAGHKTI